MVVFVAVVLELAGATTRLGQIPCAASFDIHIRLALLLATHLDSVVTVLAEDVVRVLFGSGRLRRVAVVGVVGMMTVVSMVFVVPVEEVDVRDVDVVAMRDMQMVSMMSMAGTPQLSFLLA